MSNSKQILAKFDVNDTMILECDASPVGVGCVLKKLSENIRGESECTIAFASRKLTDTEVNYSQIDKEALSIIFGVTKFNKFLLGKKFILRTDHKPLIHLFSPSKAISSIANARLTRWALKLSAFDYQIEHIQGKNNVLADGLSRLPVDDVEGVSKQPAEYIKLLTVMDETVDLRTLLKHTNKDQTLCLLRTYIRQGFPSREKINPAVGEFLKYKEELSVLEDLILFRNRVLIPSTCKKITLRMLHENHPGVAAMKSMARVYVFWPKMDEDIANFVKQCDNCFENSKPKGVPILSWNKEESSFQRVHVDYCSIGSDNFLIVMDAYSKFMCAYVTKKITSGKTIELLRRCFSDFGIPETVVSDNGPCFKSFEFQNFLDRNNVDHILVSPYHPQSNGLAERGVQSFKKLFKKQSEGSLSDKLAKTLYAYRSTVHSLTNLTPSEMMFGRRFKTKIDSLKPKLVLKGFEGKDRSKFSVGDAVYARNFGNGQEWIQGTVIEILGQRNYLVEIATENGRVLWKRHYSHIFARERLSTVEKEESRENIEMEEKVHDNKEIKVPPGIEPDIIFMRAFQDKGNTEINPVQVIPKTVVVKKEEQTPTSKLNSEEVISESAVVQEKEQTPTSNVKKGGKEFVLTFERRFPKKKKEKKVEVDNSISTTSSGRQVKKPDKLNYK